jgi:SAM-dependent methyltransferase
MLPASKNPGWRDALRNWWPLKLPAPWAGGAPTLHDRHQDTYDLKYYEFIEYSSLWSRTAMAESIVRDLAPRHAVDIGCGTGALLEALRSKGVSVFGLEYSDAGLLHCRRRSLPARKFDIARHRLPRRLKFRDLAISFEVAEHLPEALADRFVCILGEAGNTIVLSAATPGQGGTDHVNEQPHEYWIERIHRQGFDMDVDLSLRWRAEWLGKTEKWYSSNVMVFRRAAA